MNPYCCVVNLNPDSKFNRSSDCRQFTLMTSIWAKACFPALSIAPCCLNSDWFIALFTFAMIGQKIYRVKVMYTAEILYVDNSA